MNSYYFQSFVKLCINFLFTCVFIFVRKEKKNGSVRNRLVIYFGSVENNCNSFCTMEKINN
jgi:hypothetical protein